MKRLYTLVLAALALLALRLSAAAQASNAEPRVLRGLLKTTSGSPVPGANIFLLESLDAALTDANGRFVIQTKANGTVTIVARKIGFAPANAIVPVDTTGVIAMTMFTQSAVLEPIKVQAGAYTAGNERGSTLTALEVVTTP